MFEADDAVMLERLVRKFVDDVGCKLTMQRICPQCGKAPIVEFAPSDRKVKATCGHEIMTPLGFPMLEPERVGLVFIEDNEGSVVHGREVFYPTSRELFSVFVKVMKE